MKKKFLFGFLIAFFIAGDSFSQSTDLDPVTITASVHPVKTSQTGRDLFVISGDRLANLPVRSLDELLRYLPGVEVQSRGPFGAQSDIVIRGGTFQQVLVMIDGIRVNDPNTGHFTSYIPIAPAEIERIEVLKGASSALYGSDAVGGVINIVTKTFNAKKGTVKKELLTQVTGGEYQTYGLQTGTFHTNGKTAISTGINVINTKGQLQRGIRGFVKSATATISISHYISDNWQLAFRSSFDRRKFAAQNFYTNFVSDTAQETVSSYWNQLQLTRSGAAHTLRLQAGYKNLTDSFSFNPNTSTNQNKSNLWQALVTDEWKAAKKTTLVFGGQFINKSIASNDRGDHSVNSAGAFIILNQQLGEKLFIAPAARIEWNDISKTEVVPQINLSYRTPKVQLRGSAGKTVRDADFTERYNNYNKTFVSSGRIGNPDLEAERSFSYEAGIDYFATANLKISGTYFQRHHKKLIDYVTTSYNDMPRKVNLSPTGVYALAKNIAQVITTGLEANAQVSKQVGKGSLWTALGLVWLDSESSGAAPSLYLSSHAKFLFNFNMIYTYSRFSISINGLYKTRPSQTAPAPALAKVSQDYAVLNAKADARVWKMLSAFMEADNITNRRYTDLLGAPMPGRWLSAGIKISLSK